MRLRSVISTDRTMSPSRQGSIRSSNQPRVPPSNSNSVSSSALSRWRMQRSSTENSSVASMPG